DEVGFANVTVRSICKAANISIGAFYHKVSISTTFTLFILIIN
ncbi:TetR/AcrR family transcriptional regulator, partial [Clostridium saudiense]|nr:TetR/AcrR family transcriptional regulator [Clostridium saudiense]